MRNRWVSTLIGLGGLFALLPHLLLVVALRESAREPVAAGGPPAAERGPELVALPVEQWTPRLRSLVAAGEWRRMERELAAVQKQRPELYARFDLGYLQGRARLEAGDRDGGSALLAAHAAEGHPLHDLALYHSSRAADAKGDQDEAARIRERLIFEHPNGAYRDRAIADQVAFLAAGGDPGRLLAFGDRLGIGAGKAVRRQLQSQAVQALIARGEEDAARARGLSLLREDEGDDAADRVFRALDRPALIGRMDAGDWLLMGETARHHRHFDRAVELLRRALPHLPGRREDLLFALGRAQFGAEDFSAAEQTYLEGVAAARDGESRANFLYQASRAAQLQGQDARAEAQLTRAIAAASAKPPAPAPAPRRGKARRARRAPPPASPRAAAALTQRIRIRLATHRWDDADADLTQLRRLFPNGTGWTDATLGYASAAVAAGRDSKALEALRALPARLTGDQEQAEADYWTARALERHSPEAAVASYLRVLRAEAPSHFAHLALRRLRTDALAPRAAALATRRAAEAVALQAGGKLAEARAAQTDAVLLAPSGSQPDALQRLQGLYRGLAAYRAVLELKPYPLPALPVPPIRTESAPGVAGTTDAVERRARSNRRFDLLLALGLFDDAAQQAADRYPLAPPASALTRAMVLNEAGVTRRSIQAVESLMSAVPDGYLPELLPIELRQLLYPRDFYALIAEDARRHGADPRLVLSIMREESRFDPRAKSAAAARGLLQFIIGTARDVGRKLGLVDLSPEDLYDPRVVIQLGTKYVGDLLEQFGGNPYRAAAAYNAGPAQARLWARMAPGPEDDAYLSAINFDETKNYVRKVMNSYERYGAIYEDFGDWKPSPAPRAAAPAPKAPDGGR